MSYFLETLQPYIDKVPKEEWDKLPLDFAENFDFYKGKEYDRYSVYSEFQSDRISP